MLRGWQQVGAWWTALTKVSLRNKLDMATAQEARAGTGDGVMTAELTSEAVGALVPDASTTVKGKVELATSTEVRAAVGADPAAGVQDNVVTLQGIFDLVKVYEDGNLPNAVPPNGTIELVYES